MVWWCPGCGEVVNWWGNITWVFQIDDQYPYHQYMGFVGYWQAWHVFCWADQILGSEAADGGG